MKGKTIKRASGGRMPDVVSGNPNVLKEAKERKKGGRVAAPTKSVGFMTGGAVKSRMDRPGRKRGGAVGANKTPLSTAHKATSAGERMGGEPD